MSWIAGRSRSQACGDAFISWAIQSHARQMMARSAVNNPETTDRYPDFALTLDEERFDKLID